MEIRLHHDPVKYISVHGWLPPEQHQRVLDYVTQEVEYDPGLYGNPKGETLYTQVKLNHNQWLTPPNPIASEIQRACWAPEIDQACRDMNDLLFRAHRLNNLGSFLVSKYLEGDYFAWHADHTHYLTLNYVVKAADEGGVFEIALETEDARLPQDQLANLLHTAVQVPNEDNCLIIFPAMHYHRVTPVVKGSRHTVQYFLSREFPKT